MSWAMEAQRAWQTRWTEELARAWIGRIVERTPLDSLDDLALGWLGREAPALIDEILGVLNAPGGSAALSDQAAERARSLADLRDPAGAASEVPRDLASLQVLIGGALAQNADGDEDAMRRRLDRLTLVMGELHAAFAEGLVAQRPVRGVPMGPASLPDERAMQEELARLVGANGNGGGVFSLLQLDVDGLEHMRASSGAEAADSVMSLVADTADQVLGTGGRLFRRAGDELVALVPGSEGPAAAALAARLRDSVAGALGESAPLAPLSIGVAGWPAHASEPAALLERAREATYVAKSSGQGVSLPPAPRAPLPGRFGLQRN